MTVAVEPRTGSSNGSRIDDGHPTITRELITPSMAKIYLQTSLGNRKLRGNKTKLYAREMIEGRWREDTTETIKFDEDGNLRDGHHRFTAQVEARKSIWYHVARNVPDSDFVAVDTGVARTASDLLAFQGHGDTATLAAAARSYYAWNHFPSLTMLRTASGRVSNDVIAEVVSEHPDLIESVARAQSFNRRLNLIPPSVMASVHYEISRTYGIDLADEFFTRFTQGVNLEEGNPILALRNLLFNHRTKSTSPTTELKMAWLIHTFNKWIRGATNVKLIKHLAKNEFPKVMG